MISCGILFSNNELNLPSTNKEIICSLLVKSELTDFSFRSSRLTIDGVCRIFV